MYLPGYGAQLQPATTQSSSSRKIHLRTLFESPTRSVHKQHELRLSSASRDPCGQLPLQSSAPSAGRSYKDTEATAACASKHQAAEPAWGASGTGATAEHGAEGGPAGPQGGGRTPKLSSRVNHLSSFTEGFKKMGQWGGRITRRSSKTPPRSQRSLTCYKEPAL